MIRDTTRLANNKFDVLIIGGGIYGAVFYWQTCLAGFSAALIEKGDFAQATSANTQKIVHGGLRYLQQFDFPRVSQSLRERKRLMWVAPHLTHPLPCVMPIYGYGIKGKESMWVGLHLYDLIGMNRNDLSPPSKRIPRGKILSRSETNPLIPHLDQRGLRGAAQWYDAICFNTERMVLAFIKSGSELGSVAANYIKANKLIPRKDSTFIVRSQDQLTGETFDILAKNVINCTGPWIYDLLDLSIPGANRNRSIFASGINIITNKIFDSQTAVALRDFSRKNSRLYFVVPWRGKSIIGTEWCIYNGHPDSYQVTELQCLGLIDAFNSLYPTVKLSIEDILHIHGGLVPCHGTVSDWKKDIPLLKDCQIIDYSKDGYKGLISVLGVKYTTAGDVAERVLRYLFPELKIKPIFALPQLKGGEIDDLEAYQRQILAKWGNTLGEYELKNLVLNYGTEVEKVLQSACPKKHTDPPAIEGSFDIIKGETLFAVREEMAQKLSDVIFRRTDRGTAGPLPELDLIKISQLMADEMSWSEVQRKSEIEDLKDSYPSFLRS
jgi:glycerol-3-phosphate dehydrogenase